MTTQTPEILDSPAAWRGAEMSVQGGWELRLSDAEIEEIDQAVAAIDRPLIEVDRQAFPLPALGPKLARLRGELLEGRGFFLLRGLPVQRMSREEAVAAFWGIGAHFGSARSQNARGHLMGHVKDLGLKSDDPNVRVYQTSERQNFHTDSVDIVALMCLQPARSGGLSSIVSSVAVHNEIVRRRPELARELYQPFFTDRRGEVPEGMKPWFAIPVFNRLGGELTTLYARRYIESARRFPEVPALTEAQREALDLFDSLCESSDFRLDMAFEAGDMQFLCNHVIMHDRTAFEDWPEPERRRHLLRLWLCPPEGRTLPDAFAARYGSTRPGDRGGIVVKDAAPVVPLEAA